MAEWSEDPEIALALELSKRTFEDEERARAHPPQEQQPNDLISWDHPEERERQQRSEENRRKIADITKLYHAPQQQSTRPYGWSVPASNSTHTISPSGFHGGFPMMQMGRPSHIPLSSTMPGGFSPFPPNSQGYRSSAPSVAHSSVSSSSSVALSGSAPPLHPRRRQTSECAPALPPKTHRYSTSSLLGPFACPPSSSSSSSFSTTPTTAGIVARPTPRSTFGAEVALPPPPPRLAKSTISTTGTGQQPPAALLSHHIPPRPPAHRVRSQPDIRLSTTVSPSDSLSSGVNPAFVTHVENDLPWLPPIVEAEQLNQPIVPYVTLPVTGLQQGDLIEFNDDAGGDTLEQLRRDFDPLYRAPPPSRRRSVTEVEEGEGMPPVAVHPLDRNHRASLPHHHHTTQGGGDGGKWSAAAPPLRRAESADVDVPSKKHKWLALDCIQLLPHTPDTAKQIAIVKEKGQHAITDTSLYFKAPVADYPATRVHSVKLLIYKDYSWRDSDRTPIHLTCDTQSSIEMVLTEVLTLLLSDSDMQDGVPVGQYGLKIFGLDEFLPKHSALGQNLYVGKSLLHGKDIKLEVGANRPIDCIPSTSHEQHRGLDLIRSHIAYSSVLDREDVENVLSHLKTEMDAFEAHYKDDKEGGQARCDLAVSKCANKVKQCVKMLCKLLNSIEPVHLHQHLHKYITSTNENSLLNSKDDLIASVHNLVYVYCRSTMSHYRLEPLRPVPTERKEVFQVTEPLKIMVNSLHNLPDEWIRTYQQFHVTVTAFYGTKEIDRTGKCTSKEARFDAFFPYVPLDVYTVFNRQICQYPRETKLMVTLSAIPIASSPDQPDPMPKEKHLAYASIPMFDHEMVMRQGQLFIPLALIQPALPLVLPWGPHPVICNEKDPILCITLPSYHYDVLFPEVIMEGQSVRYEFSTMDMESQETLMDLVESGDTQKLSGDEQELLWQKRSYLLHLPEALPLVLASVQDWGYAFLSNVYQLLEEWTALSPVLAVQLLLPQYPDQRVRSKAIEWIRTCSSDFLFNFLPQLVEVLRFEIYENSALAVFLLSLSYKDRRFAFEIYWQLQQRIDHCQQQDFAYAHRCSLLQKELLERHESDNLRVEIEAQHRLLNELDTLQMELRREDDNQMRLSILRSRLGVLDSSMLASPVRLPILPSFLSSGIEVQDCGIFNSNAKPLRIVFKGLNSNYAIIHKAGDDMRQDMLVLHMVQMMNDVWLSEGLDLRMITFRCMPCGFKKGMAELVSDCSTLCDIQKAGGGVTGVFKDDVLNSWLVKHNPSEYSYKVALDNFQRSCAGWCVATYVLGIGDRHNDNILVTTMGHVFHIDFGKYMGDWQMAAGFKRDRVPFVFTAEMYYVINGGAQQSENYQTFIDYCCRAFNYLRQRHSILTNLIKIMTCSGVPGINIDSLSFVENNLMLELSETDATIQFTQLIQHSLKSAFPRINFFFHTLAQVMSGGSIIKESDDSKFSFIQQTFTEHTDGRLRDVRAITFEKRHLPNKVYMYKMEVCRETEAVVSIVYRSFAEFQELYMKLKRRFPTAVLPMVGMGGMRSNVKAVAQRRMVGIHNFLQALFRLRNEVAHCDLVYTFFHNILRDSEFANSLDTDAMAGDGAVRGQSKVFLRLQYNDARRLLSVFIGHVKHLDLVNNGLMPDSYVKTYLRPDQQNTSKRKTQVVRSSQNPTFNKELTYDFNLIPSSVSSRVLEVSVWNSGGLMDNTKMYMVFIPLAKVQTAPLDRKGTRSFEDWFVLAKNT